MKRLILHLGLWCSLIFLQACNQTTWKSANQNPQVATDCTVTYEEVAPILTSRCNQCHSGATPAGALSLETYEIVSKNGPSILSRIRSRSMPPQGSTPLSHEETETLALWVTNQMPRSSSSCIPNESCVDGQPLENGLKRLTRTQFINTLSSLVGAESMKSEEVQSALATIPNEDPTFSYDTMADQISSPHVDGYYRTATAIANQVSESHSALLNLIPCLWETDSHEACVQGFISSFGQRSYRRPLTEEEKTEMLELFLKASSLSREEGMRALLSAFLQSPFLLYRLETGGTPIEGEPNILALTPYEIATRVSYTYTGGPPDTELFQAASTGALYQEDEIRRQTTRLMRSDKSHANLGNFYSQWLKFRVPPLKYSPDFLGSVDTTSLRTDFQSEVDRYILYHFDGYGDSYSPYRAGTYAALMTSRLSFVSPALASLYELPKSGMIEFSDGKRDGLLTRAGLMVTGTNTTRPFHRGAELLRKGMLCDEMARPDPTTLPPAALNNPPEDPNLTTRQRFEIITNSAACQSCHSRINPITWPFERFDALGRYRTHERIFDEAGHWVNTLALNTRSEIILDGGKKINVEEPSDVGHALAESPEAHLCFAKQWFRYSLGKKETPSDMCTIHRLYTTLKGKNGTMKAMFQQLSTLPEFKYRKLTE